MITKEKIYDILTNELSNTILFKYLPVKTKLKRIAIEGLIIHKFPDSEKKWLSLNECLHFDKCNEMIKDFIEKLEKYFSHCDMSTFYENVKTLTIDLHEKKTIDKLYEILSIKTSGGYYPKKNAISIYPDNDGNYSYSYVETVLIHELLHMATTKKDRDIISCGFHKKKTETNIDIGVGLNEGYTEYLTNGVFLKQLGGAYKHLQSIIPGIEMLVGSKQLAQFYFSNDLDGLIRTMEKYASRKDVLTIIQKMDYIYECSGKPGGKKVQDILSRQVRCDLANICARQNEKLYEEGKISEEQYKRSLLALECYTHSYNVVCFLDKNGKIENYTIYKPYNYSSPALVLTPKRHQEILDQYYETKKDNITYPYKEWKSKDGLGIDDMIKRETKSQKDKRKEIELERMIYNGQSTEIIHEQHLKPW